MYMILAFGVELWTKQVILFSMKFRFMPPIYIGVQYLDIYIYTYTYISMKPNVNNMRTKMLCEDKDALCMFMSFFKQP